MLYITNHVGSSKILKWLLCFPVAHNGLHLSYSPVQKISVDEDHLFLVGIGYSAFFNQFLYSISVDTQENHFYDPWQCDPKMKVWLFGWENSCILWNVMFGSQAKAQEERQFYLCKFSQVNMSRHTTGQKRW